MMCGELWVVGCGLWVVGGGLKNLKVKFKMQNYK